MKIALIADVFGQPNNGTSITARRLVTNMRQRGHSVTIVSVSGEDESFVKLPARNFFVFNKYIQKNGVLLAKPDKDILRDVIADCDVAHLLLPFKTGRAAMKICHELKKPYTTAFHCQPQNFSSHFKLQHCKLFNSFLYNRYRRVFYRDAQFVHCPSKFIADQLVKHKYPGEKLVISNGVTPVFTKMRGQKPEEFKDKICILFTGRYCGEKRHDLLLKAARLSKYSDKIQLILAGGGPSLGKIQKLGKKLKNLPVTKVFPQEELARVINFCDLYVHPSDFEIEAISCIEAFTCGLVPVISDAAESATSQFAMTPLNMFRRGDPVSLAQRIDYWIEHPQEKEALSCKYIEYAKQFSIGECMDRMEQMFKDSIEYYTRYYKIENGKRGKK